MRAGHVVRTWGTRSGGGSKVAGTPSATQGEPSETCPNCGEKVRVRAWGYFRPFDQRSRLPLDVGWDDEKWRVVTDGENGLYWLPISAANLRFGSAFE